MSTERDVLWTAGLSHGLIHIYELAVPALLILIQAEFAAGDFAMGRIVTLYGLMFGVGALPAGLLVDRLGSRALLTACLWGSALSVAGMALSPSLLWFSVCAACMGLVLSIYHPAGTALFTHSLPMSGRVFAVHGMMGNLGVAGAGAVAGTLGALLGWRGALGSLSLLGVVLGLRVLRLPMPSLPELRRRPGRGHWPGYVTLLVGMGFLGMVYRGMTTFLPKLFATRFAAEGSSGAALGGWLSTAALLVGLWGMYVAGRAIDRKIAPARVFLIGAVVQTPFLVAVAWAADPALLPLLMAVAFFHFLTQPAGNYMVAQYVPPRLRGMGYGVYFFVSFGMGSVGASIGGWVSERAGLEWAFPAMALLLVPAVAVGVLLSFTRLGVKERSD